MLIAGAVMVTRGGRRVAAHYGSVAAELSVCRSHVGLAERSDLDVVELHGEQGPPYGRAVRHTDAWFGVVDPGRAVVVGPPCGAAPAPITALTLLGPRLDALLELTRLPYDLGAGGIRACWIAGGQAVLLREHADQALLLVPDARAEDVWQELLAAGRPLELSYVGIEALTRLDAARRQ